MSREVWRWSGTDPLLDPRLDEVMWTGELPVVVTSGPRHARTRTGGPMNDKRKRTVRTALQVALGVALAVPVLLQQTGLRGDETWWLAAIVVGASLFARAMQSDAVEALLERWLGGWLTVGPRALPTAPPVDEHDGDGDPGTA